MMQRQMEKIDIPPIPEFIELIADSGASLYACKATVDMFGLTMDDFVPQVEGIITVGEFYRRPPAARSSSRRQLHAQTLLGAGRGGRLHEESA